MLEEVYCEALYRVGGTPHQSKEKCEEQGVAERSLWTDHNRHSPFPCAARGGGGGGVGNEGVKLGKRGGWGMTGGLIFVLVSHHPSLF